MLGALTEASSVVPNQHGKERQLLALLVDEAALVLQATLPAATTWTYGPPVNS